MRGWLWIKYKYDHRSEMTGTVDLVVVGAFHGRGKRAGAYGAVLLATYNPDNDMFAVIVGVGGRKSRNILDSILHNRI